LSLLFSLSHTIVYPSLLPPLISRIKYSQEIEIRRKTREKRRERKEKNSYYHLVTVQYTATTHSLTHSHNVLVDYNREKERKKKVERPHHQSTLFLEKAKTRKRKKTSLF
jgi:hypothetical protein